MDERFSYPPLLHLFSHSDQPDDAAWDALRNLARSWNAEHRSQFVVDDDISVTLAGGVLDHERHELKAALAELERDHGCAGVQAAETRYRRAEDRAKADFVDFIGDAAPAGFVANEIDAIGPRVACGACGREGGSRDRPMLCPLEINEDLLDAPALDLINLSNNGRLVSKRLSDALTAYGAAGFSLYPVLRVATNLPSEQYFLLGATTSIVTACPTHTPMTGEPCSLCGEGGGNLLGEWHIEDELLRGLDLVSRHRHGLADLFMSRGLYAHLVASKINLVTSSAFDRCRHAVAPERSRAARLVTGPPRTGPPPRPQCSVDAFMRFVRAPHARVDCSRRGHKTERIARTFEVAHLVEPGADPAALDALEERLADVAHVRPLALQADGVVLFYQGERPSRFPTLAAIRETEGEVCVPAAIQFEKACDWLALHREMQQESVNLDAPFLGAHGIPFARIVGSSHRLVCADGLIYYFATIGNGYHNQVIAGSLPEFLGLVTAKLARFLDDGPSVTTYYDSEGKQYYPHAFHVGAP